MRDMESCWSDTSGSHWYHVILLHVQRVWLRFLNQPTNKKRPVNWNLPINPTLNISCVSVSAIFHTCKSAEPQVRWRESTNHLPLWTRVYLWSTLRAPAWSRYQTAMLGRLNKTVNVLKLVSGQGVSSAVNRLFLSVRNLFLLPGADALLATNHSWRYFGNGAFRVTEIIPPHKQDLWNLELLRLVN